MIIQLITELDVSNKYIPEKQYQPFRKQSNATIFMLKNRMSQWTYFENITDSKFKMLYVGIFASALNALGIETKKKM